MDLEKVVKSDVCWMELSIGRTQRGLDVFVKTLPQIEEFFRSLSGGLAPDHVYNLGQDWFPVAPTENLKVHKLMRPLVATSPGYIFDKPGEPLKSVRTNAINLSFLRLVGVGSPDGVHFGVTGPYSREYINGLKSEILTSVRHFIWEFLIPVQYNLRISSTEV